jgi:transcriptional regulator with XRE-family HTH domain
MPRSRLSDYFRTERLRSGLSQRELGELFGLSRHAVTKLENGRLPTLELAFAAEIVFGRSHHELLPLFHDTLKEEILLRAVAMDIRLADASDHVSLRKRAHLADLINRLQFNLPLS